MMVPAKPKDTVSSFLKEVEKVAQSKLEGVTNIHCQRLLVEDHYEVDARYSVEECLGDMMRVMVVAFPKNAPKPIVQSKTIVQQQSQKSGGARDLLSEFKKANVVVVTNVMKDTKKRQEPPMSTKQLMQEVSKKLKVVSPPAQTKPISGLESSDSSSFDVVPVSKTAPKKVEEIALTKK